MFVVLSNESYKLEINKSIFISFVFPFNNLESFNETLNKIKKDYPKAKHYLYSYKIDSITKSYDDGEPGNIAKNFLSLFEKLNINKALVIVVRYFGGIKLGKSRLASTYLEVVNESIKKAKLGIEVDFYKYNFELDYKSFNKLNDLGYKIENVVFNDIIKCSIISTDDLISKFNILKIKPINVEIIKGIKNVSK